VAALARPRGRKEQSDAAPVAAAAPRSLVRRSLGEAGSRGITAAKVLFAFSEKAKSKKYRTANSV